MTVKNILILAMMILLHAGCITVTAVSYKKIQDWKTILEYFIKESPTMSEEVRHFSLINIRILDEQRNILVFALILGAVLMSLFIFRGGILCMEVFKKENNKNRSADPNIEGTRSSGGSILKPISKSFRRLFRYETTTPRELGTAELGEVSIMSNLNRSAAADPKREDTFIEVCL